MFRTVGACILFAILLGIAQPAFTSTFMVGAGAKDISPPVGSFLAGYGPDRKSTGALDELWIKTIVVADEKLRLAIVTIDCIGLTRPDIKRVEARVSSLLGKDGLPTRLVVSSTHTHAGPDVVGLWGPSLWSSGRDERYLLELTVRIVRVKLGAAPFLIRRVFHVDGRIILND